MNVEREFQISSTNIRVATSILDYWVMHVSHVWYSVECWKLSYARRELSCIVYMIILCISEKLNFLSFCSKSHENRWSIENIVVSYMIAQYLRYRSNEYKKIRWKHEKGKFHMILMEFDIGRPLYERRFEGLSLPTILWPHV